MPRYEPARRRAPTRQLRRTFLVVIGADRTETAYLKGLRDHFRLATVTVKFIEKPCAPDQLVRHTRESFGLDDYDEVWCLTDVDHYEREGAKVSAARAAAGRSGIKLAVSDPCFELWLLLHHESCTRHCADCGVVERRLTRFVESYDKTRLRFADFAEGLDAAIERARNLNPGSNPSTEMWRPVTALLERE